MKIIIAADELPICISKRDAEIAIRRYISKPLKRMPQTTKASKIQIEFEEEKSQSDLQIFPKPHFMALDMLDEKDICFVGAPGLYEHDEFNDEERKKIEKTMMSYRCHTVFEEKTTYARIMEEILKRNTYEYTQKNLDHAKLFEEYERYNRKYCEKIMQIHENGDAVWIMDHNLFLLPQMLGDVPVGITFHLSFSTLFKCIPFWERLFVSIMRCKYVEFVSKASEESFSLLASQKMGILTDDTPYKDLKMPKTGFSKKGIDKEIILSVLGSRSTDVSDTNRNMTILVSCDSPVYLLGVEAYLSRYNTNIEVMFLSPRITNIERHAEVSRLKEYLEINYGISTRLFVPSSDSEFYSGLKECSVCHCPEVADVCSFLGVPTVQSNPYDFTEVADEIKNKIGKETSSSASGSDRSCCAMNVDVPPSKNDWKEHFITHLLSVSGIDEKIDLREKEVRMRNSLVMDPASNTLEVKANDGNRKCENIAGVEKNTTQIDVDDSRDPVVLKILEDFKRSRTRTLVLDYDGTLVDIVSHPEMAAPTQDVKDLLTSLNKICRVVICTGRSIKDSDSFFPKEIEVFGEHAACHRVNGKWTEGKPFEVKDFAWRIGEFFRQRTPGAELEQKKTGYTFHYRNAPSLVGRKQAKALFEILKRVCGEHVKEGNNIIEVRSSKKSVAMETLEEGFVLCAGDDVADEEMLGICKGYTIKVGESKETMADYTIKDPRSFRMLLKRLVE